MPPLQLSPIVRATLLLASAGSLAVVILLVVIGGASTPGYRHTSQFISELGATGAPVEGWVRLGGFFPAGSLLLLFCTVAFRTLPRSRPLSFGLLGLAVYAAGYLVASFFPCDPGCRPAEPSTSQWIHNVGGLAGYVLAPAFLLALAFAVRRWPRASGLAAAGYVAATAALLGLLTLSPDSDVVGLSQRLLEASVLSWVLLLGLYCSRCGSARAA
ncbi:MAG: DUF998 domain-containing protein [Bacteroidota bacterium]